jgi:hypothetical protein
MTKTRLLYLKSINDESTLREIEYMSRSKIFESFDIRVCFALLMRTYKERDTYEVSFQDLLKNLEEEILYFKPHKFLLHTGTAFRVKPASYLQALAVIKSNHPEIGIYYERVEKTQPLPELPIYGAYIPLEELLNDNDLFSGDEKKLLP